jgi:hypothetical protein
MLSQSTKADRGLEIIGNAFLLQFTQISIAREGPEVFSAKGGVSAIGGLI